LLIGRSVLARRALPRCAPRIGEEWQYHKQRDYTQCTRHCLARGSKNKHHTKVSKSTPIADFAKVDSLVPSCTAADPVEATSPASSSPSTFKSSRSKTTSSYCYNVATLLALVALFYGMTSRIGACQQASKPTPTHNILQSGSPRRNRESRW
jgi:hypothetical protein